MNEGAAAYGLPRPCFFLVPPLRGIVASHEAACEPPRPAGAHPFPSPLDSAWQLPPGDHRRPGGFLSAVEVYRPACVEPQDVRCAHRPATRGYRIKLHSSPDGAAPLPLPAIPAGLPPVDSDSAARSRRVENHLLECLEKAK